MIPDLDGCKAFSKIDLNQEYYQIPLHPHSTPLTTFSTHLDALRFKRVYFGLSCDAEILLNINVYMLFGRMVMVVGGPIFHSNIADLSRTYYFLLFKQS